MNKRTALFLLSIFALLTACSSQGASSTVDDQKDLEIKIGMFSFASYAPLFIAEAEGFYDEQGIEVTFVPFTSGTDALVALIQGEIDVSAFTLGVASLRTISEETGLKYVADKGFLDENGCTYTAWMVRNEVLDSGQLDDLVNITDLNIIYRKTNAYIDFGMDELLKPTGLTSEDLNIAYVPHPNREEAFRNGTIDIALTAEPWITRMLNAGVAQIWVPLETSLPDAQLAVIWYGPTLSEDNREAGKRFMVAYLKAVRQFNKGKTDRNVELMAEFTQLDTELVRESCWQAFKEDGSINFQTIEDLQVWAVNKGLLEEIVPMEAYWDGDFIEYANSVLE